MLNHIVIMGRLGKDPELRRTQSGVAVATFNVAVDRDFKDKATGQRATDWITCVAWRSTAEFVEKYFAKGSQVLVAESIIVGEVPSSYVNVPEVGDALNFALP